jgi:hypothetical protein
MDAFGYYRVTGLLRKNNLGFLRAGPSTFVDGFFVAFYTHLTMLHIRLVFMRFILHLNFNWVITDKGMLFDILFYAYVVYVLLPVLGNSIISDNLRSKNLITCQT